MSFGIVVNFGGIFGEGKAFYREDRARSDFGLSNT